VADSSIFDIGPSGIIKQHALWRGKTLSQLCRNDQRADTAHAYLQIIKNRKMVTAMPIFSRFSRLSLIMAPALVESSPTVLTSAGAPDF
jgi:hypothetical protein